MQLRLEMAMPMEIYPSSLPSFSVELSSDEVKKEFSDHVYEYLSHLTVNSAGQRILTYGVNPNPHYQSRLSKWVWRFSGYNERTFSFLYSWKFILVIVLALALVTFYSHFRDSV